MYKSFAFVSVAKDMDAEQISRIQLQDLLCAFFIIVIVNYTLLVPAQTSTMCTRVRIPRIKHVMHVVQDRMYTRASTEAFFCGLYCGCTCDRSSAW